MPKLKAPFLSFASAGTLGKAITTQKRHLQTIARTKPTPTDRYALPQAYQRWLYQDYCYLFSQLSDAEKRTWYQTGARRNITPLAAYLRTHLKNLTYHAAIWHLDEATGNIAHDSSKNTNHGTIIGASPTTGIINGARLFDGIDDEINVPDHPTLHFTGKLTIEVTIIPKETWADRSIVHGTLVGVYGWSYWLEIYHNKLLCSINGQYNYDGFAQAIFPDNTYRLVMTYDQDLAEKNIKGFINGTLHTWKDYQGDLTSQNGVTIGRTGDARFPWHGTPDEIVIWNIVLPDELIKRHALRRYPS